MIKARRHLAGLLFCVLSLASGEVSAGDSADRESYYRDYALTGARLYDKPAAYIYRPKKNAKERAASTVAAAGQLMLEAQKADGAAHWLEAARASADSLVAHADMNGDGKFGWGRYWPSLASRGDADGGATPFGRGCELSRDRPYGDELFDVARVAQFLIGAFEATQDQKYLDAARRAIDDTWDLGSETVGGRGFAYAKTAGPCSHGWHVKNINMLMAVPIAMLASHSDDRRYRDRYDRMMAEEKAQFEGTANLGYYSIETEGAKGDAGGYVAAAQKKSADAIVCSVKTGSGESCSNHLGLEARALFLAGRASGDDGAYKPQIMALMNGFLAVDPQLCEAERTPRGRAPNATSCVGHYCALRRFDQRFDELCYARLRARNPRTLDVYLGLLWGAPDQAAK